jgi:hypothetical protein
METNFRVVGRLAETVFLCGLRGLTVGFLVAYVRILDPEKKRSWFCSLGVLNLKCVVEVKEEGRGREVGLKPRQVKRTCRAAMASIAIDISPPLP